MKFVQSGCCDYLCTPQNEEVVDHLAPFRIPFVGLKPGQHDFQMEVDSLFFESFPSSETDQITGEAEVTIDKLGSKMDCIVRFSGAAILPCDRCLGDVQIPLSFDERLVVQLGESTNTEEEIWTLGPECHELDLSQPIFEWMHLHLPSRRLHVSEDQCDPAMTAYLNGGGTASDDPDGSSDDGGSDENDGIDPRWNALKDLK